MTARLRVMLVCSGLDHARRGYESFARECFEALRGQPGLELELVKGSGPVQAGERTAPALRRDRVPARALGRMMDARPFRLEAFTFGFGLQPLLRRRRPDVVYLSEWDTAKVLARSRRATGLGFKLLLCNGGFAEKGFEHLDHVQELTPGAREWVLARGADPRRHTVLPLGFHIDEQPNPVSAAERTTLRRRLGLPEDRTIVVSVAALNRTHKRLDYLIEELAGWDEPKPFLLLVGEPEEETRSVRALARERLGANGFAIRTVAHREIPDVLRSADAFALTSLVEAQGRALIEAASQGLPCLAHDSPITRYAVGDHAFLGDFGHPGALQDALERWRQTGTDSLLELSRAAHAHVEERFSWRRLRPRYVALLRAVAYSTVSSSSGE